MKPKIITMCGSLKFEHEHKLWAEKLELEGNCVLSVITASTPRYKKPHFPLDAGLVLW